MDTHFPALYFAPFVGGPCDGDVRPVPAQDRDGTLTPMPAVSREGQRYLRVPVQGPDAEDCPWEYTVDAAGDAAKEAQEELALLAAQDLNFEVPVVA